MNFACIHTHTNFCDGHDNIETYCRTAVEKGFKSLGFSAHAPVTAKTGFKTNWHLCDDRLTEYIESVTAAKRRWEAKLRVYLGFEVDFIDGLICPADKDYLKLGLDYIIASVHYVIPPKGEPFTIDGKPEIVDRGIKEGYGGDPMGMVEAYLDAEETMIRRGGFDVLGHIDLVKMNNHRKDAGKLFSENGDFYKSKLSGLAKLMAERPLDEGAESPVCEINTGGLNRGKINECYPSLGFLKLLRAHNVPVVINSDAHRAIDLDGHYEDAHKTLLEAGYTETVLFEGRLAGKAVWKPTPL